MNYYIKKEKSIIKNILRRLKDRNFSGNSGQAVRNSTYQLATNITAKIGSLIFTAIIARMLLPELFGLYSLALSTIIFFSTFAEIGLDSAMITFISKFLANKKEQQAKNNFYYILKLKLILVLVSSLILMSLAFFISKSYYQKPIFLALLAGGLYIPLATLSRFAETLFTANNDFKSPLKKEIIFQFIKFTAIPLSILALLKISTSKEIITSFLILLLSFCYLLSLIYLIWKANQTMPFLKKATRKVSKKEKEKIIKFTIPLTVTVLSGVFFGYIDTLMLGHFVSGEFIGYYGVAFSLIGAAMTILSFLPMALFPIFSRLKGARLRQMLKQGVFFSLIISIFATIFTFFTADYIIEIIYGNEYLQAALFLKYYSVLLTIGGLISIFQTYIVSQEKTLLFAKAMIASTTINIVLNYFFITNGLKIGMLEAVLGACVSTIISRVVYLVLLFVFVGRGD